MTAILLGVLIKSQSKNTTVLPSKYKYLVTIILNISITYHIGTAPLLRWNKTGVTVAGITGNPGSSNNQLNWPYDVILDYANNMYIVDRINCRIQKYLYGKLVGQTVAGNGTCGSSQYLLSDPMRVILDSNENVYITDRGNNRVQLWLKDATFGKTVAGTTGKFI